MTNEPIKSYQWTVAVWPERGKPAVHLIVPDEQVWLHAMLERQEKALNGIKSACTVIALLVVLTAIVSACNAIGLI